MNLQDEVTYELVYDDKAFSDIKEKWSQAEQKDARDDDHPDRITVKIPGVNYRDFYYHAMDKGYCAVCLSFELNLLRGREKEPDFFKLIDKWIKNNPK